MLLQGFADVLNMRLDREVSQAQIHTRTHTQAHRQVLSLQRMWQCSKSQFIHLWSEEADLQTSDNWRTEAARVLLAQAQPPWYLLLW